MERHRRDGRQTGTGCEEMGLCSTASSVVLVETVTECWMRAFRVVDDSGCERRPGQESKLVFQSLLSCFGKVLNKSQ